MNIIWSVLMIASITLLLFTSPGAVLGAFSSASQSALKLSLQMVGIYAIWMGIMSVAAKCGLTAKLSRILKPLTKLLFGDTSPETREFVSLNLSANLLGLGNAATPMGIKAAASMKDSSYALAMLMVINCAGLQFIPTTVISLRAELGSLSAGSILVPALLSSLVSCIAGILLVAVFFRRDTPTVKKL